jgi:hypothetical protein
MTTDVTTAAQAWDKLNMTKDTNFWIDPSEYALILAGVGAMAYTGEIENPGPGPVVSCLLSGPFKWTAGKIIAIDFVTPAISFTYTVPKGPMKRADVFNNFYKAFERFIEQHGLTCHYSFPEYGMCETVINGPASTELALVSIS